jgi:alpha-L-fucosidase
VLEISFAKPVVFDHTVTMEWLNDGQHVEKYAVEAWEGKGWKQVTGGNAIGHKKIDAFAPVTASRVRLRILSSTREAHIRELQIFRIDAGGANSTTPQ